MPSVLLVEDDLELCELLGAALQAQGLTVHSALTLARARAVLSEEALDLAVIDGFLPDGSGVALIESLRAEGSALQIIFLSALWRDEDILRRLTEELAVSRVLHKPMGVQAFVAQVMSCLGPAEEHEAPRPLSAQAGLNLFRRELASGFKRASAAPRPPRADASATPRVLVVDGEPGVHQHLKGAGRELFVELELAAGPAEAVSLASERPPDAVLLELGLAARDSGALLRRLRALPGLASLPMGVLSDHGSMERRLEGADLGAKVFLLKPLGLAPLDHAVQRLLATRERPGRVLIVDDDPGFTAELRSVLRAAGVEAHGIHQPRGTLASLAELRPDLLLLDGMMPDVAGADLCRVVRASAGWENLPILMLTGLGGEAVRREGLEAGADAVLLKGEPSAVLLARIQTMIERYRAQSSQGDRDLGTGLLHRRAFLRAFSQRSTEALRHGHPLSLGLIRLQGLAALRARSGAIAADELLAAAARVLSTELRGTDLKGRWGPAELCVGLPYAEAPQSSRAVGRLARRINAMLLDRDDQVAVDVQHAVSAIPEDGLGAHALMRRAEQRLTALSSPSERL